MEEQLIDDGSWKPEEGVRSVPFEIDLNEMPVCSPREIVSSAASDDVSPAVARRDAPALDKGKGKKVALLDINALPNEADESCELVNSGMHTVRDTSSIGNSNNVPVTCSNMLFMGNRFDLMKASDNILSTVKSSPVDIVQHKENFGRNLKEADLHPAFVGRNWASDYSANSVEFQNLSEKFLQSLREYIFDKKGILQDGWNVQFIYCQNSRKTIAVYCSPDGNKFESMFDVACHLGLVSNCHSLPPQYQCNGFPLVQNRSYSNRRRKEPLIFSRTKDFKEYEENLKSGFAGEFCLGVEAMDVEVYKLRTNLMVTEANTKGTSTCTPSRSKDVFPVQFEDFFILSIGEVDTRPSYHNSSQIWPVGYKSSWHDKITGSVFLCDVLDGGDTGPIFKVQRYPCSTKPIPVGTTVLSRPTFGTDKNKTNITLDAKDDEDINIQIILSDHSAPQLDLDFMSGPANAVDKPSNFQTVNGLETDSNCISKNIGKNGSNLAGMSDVIGEFLVEGRSPSLVWRMVSQNLVCASHEVYKQTGACTFSCRHHGYGDWSLGSDHDRVDVSESADSLAKFCHWYGPFNVLHHIQSNDELATYCEALAKWLDQDRFGLDIEFVQEMIEQLPGVQSCPDYRCLGKRSDNSKSKTVSGGYLLAKRSDVQCEKETDVVFQGCQEFRKVVENSLPKIFLPPGKPLNSKLSTNLIGDVLQSWELLWRFSEVLGLEEPLSFEELERELIDCYSCTLRSFTSTVHEKDNHDLVADEGESLMEIAKRSHAYDANGKSTSETLIGVQCSLLKVLLVELQTKLTAFVDPTLEGGESKSRKKRKKETDSLILAMKTMLELLPINELTWPELARRYILTVSSVEGNLDSVETVSRESSKVFHCLQGDSGVLSGSLPGVAGMEADALLLAEATKQIFGSSKNINDNLNVESNDSEGPSSRKTVKVNDGKIPEWAQALEPVRKLPTNVGARIRRCIYEALDRNPPEWARKILEHSISKEVYKGNASGPTKKAVLSLLADLCGEDRQQKPIRKRKGKCAGSLSDVIMKQCRKVLRLAVAADEDKVFCNLLGRTLFNTSENDDEGLLGFPTMVSRPLDFRTIDLRLAFGAYGGSHEAFLEDVREVWHHIQTAYADQTSLVHLAAKLSQNFEELYEKEVLAVVHKLTDYAAVESLTSEAKKVMEDLVEQSSQIPKAPWDEGVCKICGIDKDDDNVLLCDKCDSGCHTYCLNPPLTRIPEGNWYCPSCVAGHCISQASSQVLQFNNQCRKKRHQGKFTRRFLGDLAHLGETMEVKDYWEYNVEERIFLLKFLADEMLSSANIREHLDQCFSTSADLQQKLRSLCAEWRSLKFREEFLTEKLAKENSSVLNGVGKSGMVGTSILLPHNDKKTGQLYKKGISCSSPSSDLICLEDGIQWHWLNDIDKQTRCFYSKSISDRHSSCSANKFLKIPRPERQSVKDSNLMSENLCSNTLPTHVKEEIDLQCLLNGNHAARGNFNNEVELKWGSGLTLPACEVPQGHVSSGTHVNSEDLIPNHHRFFQPDANELQACSHEATHINNRISVLQESIASLESQLQKVSLRKDFLGKDSAGRLYWIFYRPGSSPWVVVDGTMMVQQKRNVEEHRKLLSNSVTLNSSLTENLLKFKGSNVSNPYSNEWNIGIPTSSQWFSYQSDGEIEKLIKWLRESEPMEKELLESLLQRLKVGYSDSNKTGNCAQNICQPISKPINVEKSMNSTLKTKALAALEKKYGPCLELDATDIILKQSHEATSRERIYRCKCLEPIWPSRHHCNMCHDSFPSSSVLKEHNNGKCSSGVHNSENSKGNDGIKKGKATAITEEEVESSDKTRPDKSGTFEHENGNGLGGLPKDSSPFNFEEICAKFVTSSSNKELVEEIGLLGSNGIPSFVPCASPYLTDPTLKLALSLKEEGNQSNKSSNVESRLKESMNVNGISCPADEIYEAQNAERSYLMCDKYFKKVNPRLGNAKISAIRDSSLRPLVGRGTQILRQLKMNLLDMDAALPEEALKLSKTCVEKRCTWRIFVKSAKSVFEMVEATIALENMIKTEYLKNEWWYWSSLSAAAKIATLSSLALRIYTLDAAIIYEKTLPFSSPEGIVEVGSKPDSSPSPSMDPTSIPKSSGKTAEKTPSLQFPGNAKPQRKAGKKKKDSGE